MDDGKIKKNHRVEGKIGDLTAESEVLIAESCLYSESRTPQGRVVPPNPSSLCWYRMYVKGFVDGSQFCSVSAGEFVKFPCFLFKFRDVNLTAGG